MEIEQNGEISWDKKYQRPDEKRGEKLDRKLNWVDPPFQFQSAICSEMEGGKKDPFLLRPRTPASLNISAAAISTG